jgi:hypothetical protein
MVEKMDEVLGMGYGGRSASVRAQKFLVGLFGAMLMVVQVAFVIIMLDRFLYVENAELAMAVTRSGISGGAGGSFGCFGANSTVLLQDWRSDHASWQEVPLLELRIGDQVAAINERNELFSTAVFFIRDYPAGPVVRIHLENGVTVELTGGHLLPVMADNQSVSRLVPARELVSREDIVLVMPQVGAQMQPQRVDWIEEGLWTPSRLVYTEAGHLLVSGVACSSWEHPSDAYTSWDAYALYKLGLYSLLESSVYGAYFDTESAIADPWMHRLWPTGRKAREL